MFSDLVGSTALSARLDPEELREVISAYHRCVAEEVRRFDGFVAKYMGDGVLGYFAFRALTRTMPSGPCALDSISLPRSDGSTRPQSARSRCASASPRGSWWSAT
jgi:class 3 adenylate cyclase